jgi:hypothetical protein
MKLGEEILKQLNKLYAPSTTLKIRFKSYDIIIKTNEAGEAIQAFVGKLTDEGTIKGDRYARTLKYDRDGIKIKDHWERKGRAS